MRNGFKGLLYVKINNGSWNVAIKIVVNRSRYAMLSDGASTCHESKLLPRDFVAFPWIHKIEYKPLEYQREFRKDADWTVVDN